MIPTEKHSKVLWQKYHLPEMKQAHSALVARVAVCLAKTIMRHDSRLMIDNNLLVAGALLHDIDKNIPGLPGEHHPDAGVRVLRETGMDEVAEVIRTHPLHMILDPLNGPVSWEQKLLYLADKMVKYEVIGVDARFALWRKEALPPEAIVILDRSYPLVKKLEENVCAVIGIPATTLAQYCRRSILEAENMKEDKI